MLTIQIPLIYEVHLQLHIWLCFMDMFWVLSSHSLSGDCSSAFVSVALLFSPSASMKWRHRVSVQSD